MTCQILADMSDLELNLLLIEQAVGSGKVSDETIGRLERWMSEPVIHMTTLHSGGGSMVVSPEADREFKEIVAQAVAEAVK